MNDKPLNGRRIFVVEDESAIVMLLEDMLEELGCELAAASARPAQAIAAIPRSTPIDAAILDINLDGQTSYDVADALAASGIPFAFATGYGSNGLKDGYAHRPVLQKPFTLVELERTLSHLIQR